MKRSILIITVLSCLQCLILAEKIHVFDEPFEHPLLAMDGQLVCVADRGTNIIHVFDQKSFEKVAKFGGTGQGPAEFEYINIVRLHPEFIFVSASRKLSYFSREGKFKRTFTPRTRSGSYLPLKKNFVCKTYVQENPKVKTSKIQIELLNSKFKVKKNLQTIELMNFAPYNFETKRQDVLLTRDCSKFDVDEDKLILGTTTKGFYFCVFDFNGGKINEFTVPFKRIKVTSKWKNRIVENMRQEMGEQRFNDYRRRVGFTFQEYFPAYSDFIVSDEKIYVFSYPLPDSSQEIIVLNFEGKILQKTKLPTDSPYYCIYKGKYFSLAYNDESYEWELHVSALN